jgi:hypothetical protein
MKKYILFSTILIAACSSNTTAPVSPAPLSPINSFPKAFKQLTVTFQSLPDHWTYSSEIWGSGPTQNSGTSDSGSRLFSRNWTFNLDEQSFTQAGDTLKNSAIVPTSDYTTESIFLVVDPTTNKIDTLQLSYLLQSYFPSESYSIKFVSIPYQLEPDSSVLIKISGQALNNEVASLIEDSTYYDDGTTGGETDETEDTFSGNVSDSASLTMRLIP